MKTILSDKPVPSPLQATGTQPHADARSTRLSDMAKTLHRAYLQVFGIPDYERYMSHMASHHPGDPLLSRREFCARAIDRKYARNGPRCC
jgi:uncharacterized short protein YbdD (DUF466 family)